MPDDTGIDLMSRLNASRPPAEAPTPITGKSLDEVTEVFVFFGAAMAAMRIFPKVRFKSRSQPVADGIQVHAGAYGSKQNDIALVQTVVRKHSLPHHIEKRGNSCHRTVP